MYKITPAGAPQKNPIKNPTLPKTYPKTVKTTIYPPEETKVSKRYEEFFGEHYRYLYGKEIEAQVVLLDNNKHIENLPNTIPTDKNENLCPKTFVIPNEIIAPIISNTIGKIILLLINLDLQTRS